MFRGFRFLNMKFGTKLLSGKKLRTFEKEKKHRRVFADIFLWLRTKMSTNLSKVSRILEHFLVPQPGGDTQYRY